MTYSLEHHTVPANGQQLHVVQCGPAAGPLVVLLHGFPDFWYGWHHRIQALAEAGYCVWAPDQRGYNLSSKPSRIRDYQVEELGADVVGLIAAAGRDQATVVGHDWGAAVTWWLAAHRPERVVRAAVMNVPHPTVLARALRRNGRQRRRSWYMFFFQLPRLPEWWLRRRHYRALRRSLQATSRPGTFGESEIAMYQAAWAQPNALRGMVNWYRAVRYQRRATTSMPPIAVPMRIIWGAQDAFLLPELAQESLDYCKQGELFYLPEASHWAQHEEPARVNQLLLEFLAQP